MRWFLDAKKCRIPFCESVCIKIIFEIVLEGIRHFDYYYDKNKKQMQFNYRYGGSSAVTSNANSTGIAFAPDTLRTPTFFVGQLGRHIPFREAISALHDVVVSDLRFKPKDKTQYKEWAAEQEKIWLGEYMAELMKNAPEINARIHTIKETLTKISQERTQIMSPFYKSRGEYYKYLYEKDRDTWFVLDPVITVHPDEVFFECFSQDESTYGKLGANYEVFDHISEFECGTTNIDYSAALYNEFQKIRTYKNTDFRIDPSGFEIQTADEDLYKETKIDLPDSWVRGFLQVSSAMTLPAVTFDLDPADVYNLCWFLRRNRAKESPRYMRYILKPDQPIEIEFMPWGKKIKCARSIYKGKTEREVKVWGRRRLLILERLIPIARKFKVHLLGTGLPSFYVADLGDMNFTLGLSGWTANDWARAGNFDLMAPRATVDFLTKNTVFNALKENWSETAASLANRLNLDQATVTGALSAYTQAGRVIYDLDKETYRVRELTQEPLPMEQLRFASEQEALANELLQSAKIKTSKNQLANGIEYSGTIRKDGYRFDASVVIDEDERIQSGKCSCHFYKQNQLRKGPCEHILAVRMRQ